MLNYRRVDVDSGSPQPGRVHSMHHFPSFTGSAWECIFRRAALHTKNGCNTAPYALIIAFKTRSTQNAEKYDNFLKLNQNNNHGNYQRAKKFPCAPVAKINPINQFNKKSSHHTQKRKFPLGTFVEQRFLL